nr:DUF3592 domain-containing protein [Corynebacterium lactis]
MPTRRISLANWPRRLRQLLLFLLTCLLVSCAGMVVGSWLNDRAINANRGEAVANVRSVEVMRTTVDFVDGNGDFQSPPTGLLYPVGLEEGQRVRVEYNRADPNVVRVAGRAWTLSIIPAASIAFVGLIVAAPLWWISVRATSRSQRTSRKVNDGSPELRNELEN